MKRYQVISHLYTLLTAIMILLSFSFFAQKHHHPHNKGPGDPCVNMDFESCDYNGWILTQGFVDANPYTLTTPTPTTNWGNGGIPGFPATVSTPQIADQHFITSTGIDPNAPIQMTNPFGGTCTAMLGDGLNDRRHAARMSQTFLVTNANANFAYYYAAVLEDPSGHSLGQKPYFRARIYDQNNQSIICAEYEATAGDGSPGWINNGTLQYKDWTTVTAPLQAYIGQNVTVEFTVGDCSQGGHAGYVYIEASCAPLAIIPSDTTLCGGTPVTLTAPSPFTGTYLWHPGGQTTSSITVATPGAYSVDLITAPGCQITLQVNITAGSSAIANFSSDTVCVGVPTSFIDASFPTNQFNSWAWDFNNDGIVDDTTQHPTHTFPIAGLFPVKLSISNDGSCARDTIIQVLVAAPPSPNFSFSEICAGNPTQFTDRSTLKIGNITSWFWTFNGTGNSNAQHPNYSFIGDGLFPVSLVVSNNGCTDSITLNVPVHPFPQVDFASTAAGCAPICTQFNNNSSISSGFIQLYEWDFGDGSLAEGTNPEHCFNNRSRVAVKEYDIQLTATSDKGCKSTKTIPNMITVYPIPLADFIMDPPLTDEYNKTINFTDQSIIPNSWTWYFGDGANSNLNHPTHEYDGPGNYFVSLFVENQFGCRDTMIQELIIRPSFSVWIPNVFTPDGDGTNDFFKIDGFGLTEIDLRIYDRWGVLVHHQVDVKENISWDGHYHGQMVQQDTYIYKAHILDVHGNGHDYVGKVTLLK